MRRLLLFVILAVLSPCAAWPQGDPLGPEFRVNTYTPEPQAIPSVAADGSGNFVVVWQSGASGPPPSLGQIDVFGQRYASSGAPLGPEFRVNTYTTAVQSNGVVASDVSGNFVVVWSSLTQPAPDTDLVVFGQRYASSGAPLGSEFRVNTGTALASTPAVALDAAGNFVVVWSRLDGSFSGVFGQRFASSGVPLGAEFQVNTYTTNIQGIPAIASDPMGNFVVVWQSRQQDGDGFGVFGQRYASTGAPLGPEFRVNTHITYYQREASVAVAGNGDFIVVWSSYAQDGASEGVFGQRYSASGAPLGPEFRANTFTPNPQNEAGVAADSAGNFVVVWTSEYQEGPPGPGAGTGVFGQRYASAGAPSGPEFRVNTVTLGGQYEPSVAAAPGGNFVVVWPSSDAVNFNVDVLGQRFGQIVPVELMRFAVE